MDTHVKVLGVLYLAFSALYLLIALFLMLAIGGAAGIVGLTADSGDAAVAIPVLGIAGTALGLMLLVLALPGLITGWGLLNYKAWARILGIILSVLNLLNIPFGTALGIYGLWVLLNKNTERLFAAATTLPSTP
jgi:hypothetical protein